MAAMAAAKISNVDWRPSGADEDAGHDGGQ
jgi:hypothetical protein